MTDKLILVVEDDPDSALLFCEVLKMAGFEVEVAGNGAVAASRLEEIVPALVVLDLHLPLIGGIRILQQIRSDPRLATTRVLVATANDRLVNVVEHQSDAVLVKPISINTLRKTVQRLVRQASETVSEEDLLED
ncbi:MAG TPA: response regulator [Anaerolineae bacterium]|nr:response regulator [Anaerolineae bacterium]